LRMASTKRHGQCQQRRDENTCSVHVVSPSSKARVRAGRPQR
jgi:hypothetical protein